ncbi:MAG: AAA family ATPase [Gemmataceae bacterium]|nr:AAA family ATPase [Gemmataceae bacterium]
MSGLPGSGKDHHVRERYGEWERVSLDDLRDELGVDPSGKQGEVVNAARERAKELLRRGERFVWNATNLGRQMRRMTLDLLLSYKARVRIVYLEVPPAVQLEQNKGRKGHVPAAAIEKMQGTWEVPTLMEAHEVECVVRTG